MKLRSLQFAVLALLAPAAAAAQGGAAGGGMGGGMGRMATMHPFAMEVPPEAAAFAKALGLNADQTAKYAKLRDAEIKATKPTRDSLDAARTKAREAMQAGNREEGMQMMQSSRAQMQTLQQAAESFDNDLSFVLTPEQQTKYDEWKQKERERIVQERRAQFGGGRRQGSR